MRKRSIERNIPGKELEGSSHSRLHCATRALLGCLASEGGFPAFAARVNRNVSEPLLAEVGTILFLIML